MSFPSYLEEACVELHACNESCSLSQPGPSSHSLCATGIVRFRHGCLKKVVQDCPSGARTCPGIQAVTSPSRSPGQARVLTGTHRLVHISRLASMGAKVLLGSISIRLPCLQSPGTEKTPRLTHQAPCFATIFPLVSVSYCYLTCLSPSFSPLVLFPFSCHQPSSALFRVTTSARRRTKKTRRAHLENQDSVPGKTT